MVPRLSDVQRCAREAVSQEQRDRDTAAGGIKTAVPSRFMGCSVLPITLPAPAVYYVNGAGSACS